MAIASRKWWEKVPEARVPREDEPGIPYVDFSVIHRVLVAAGDVWKGDPPELSRDDRLYIRCSDDPDANVMRYEGKWWALTRPDAHALAAGIFGDDEPDIIRGA
jgi:hypothetical protein